MEMGIVSSYEVRTIDRVWFLPRGDNELTLARLATAAGISIGRTVTKTVTNADEFCSESNGALLLVNQGYSTRNKWGETTRKD